MKFMSDTSLSELVAKIKETFIKNVELRASTPDGTIDLNSITSDGFYTLFGMGASSSPGYTSQGHLIVFNYFTYSAGDISCVQIWIDRAVSGDVTPGIYIRPCYGSTWGVWKYLLNYDDYEYILQCLDNKLNTSDFTLSNITGTLPITKGGTGATTRSDAFKNLSFENYTCTTFSSGNSYYTDLDDLKSAGNYYVKADDNTHSIMQNFSVVNGWLTVLPSASTQVKQILYRYGSVAGNNDHQIYVRTYFSTGWTEWARVYTTKDIIPIANGGTGTGTTPSMLVDLNSTTADNPYNSSPRPGVTGTLPISKGGTGSTSTPSMIVDLGSTSAASPYGSSPRPGVTGTLPIANGGTGAATASAALANLGISTANSGNSGSVKIGNILVQWGKVSITNTDTSTVATHTITFDSGLQYSSAPKVFVTPLTSAPDKVRVTAIPTSSGITFYLLRTSNVSNTGVDWVAVGVSS